MFDITLLFRSSTSPVVIALIEPVTAIALTFFPNLFAELKRLIFLPMAKLVSFRNLTVPYSEDCLPLDIRLLEMCLKVCMGRIIRHRCSNVQHVVVIAFLKDLIKDTLGCVVGDLYEVDLRSIPLWMYGHKFGAGPFGADTSCDSVPCLERLVDHRRTNEAIGTCDEYFRHGQERAIKDVLERN